MADKTTFHASCHCKASTLSFAVPTASLPLPTHFCHCSICRRTHGTLCTIHTPIPPPDVDLKPFTAYASSDGTTRYFCGTCGAPMVDRVIEGEGEGGVRWYVATSLVDGGEEVWDFGAHIYVESTGDGGLARWLGEVGGKRVRMWRGEERDGEEFVERGDWEGGDSSALAASTTGVATGALDKSDGKLKAQCHCGGIEFYIARPSGDAFKDIPASLTPTDKTKWYALTDVCTSCRLVSGNAIISWAFPLISHITLADGSPYRPVFGTAKLYSSSPGVTRTFCGTCGALVVYACDDRPLMVDVGVGLLQAESGALAENWLEWRTHKVGYGEDCRWKGLLGSLERGLKSWGEGQAERRKT